MPEDAPIAQSMGPIAIAKAQLERLQKNLMYHAYERLFANCGINELALSFTMHLLDETNDLTMSDRISS
ncbi:unnamed protein product [Urochloa humidicola]